MYKVCPTDEASSYKSQSPFVLLDGMDISNQKTVNEDTADNDVEMTGQLTHYELVQRCKKELINFPLPITRSFHHVNKHFKKFNTILWPSSLPTDVLECLLP
ncbi:uncharacterized protein LOC143244363 [Tachypleus tridentatus]|uniref:uncharacterized protein LOC143244363 n=1 Tax=Tachypleus tridentatus TaxID=6853 RepID=UPI003FD6B060